MNKKHFIALADHIRKSNDAFPASTLFTPDHLDSLADFCAKQNPAFNRERWLGYIAGTNGPSGGSK